MQFEKQVRASVSKYLEEIGLGAGDLNHYMLVSAAASSQIEGNALNLNSLLVSKANNKNSKEVKEIENLLKAYQYAKRYSLTQKGLLKCHELLATTFSNLTKGQKGKYRKTQVGLRGWQGLVYLAVEPENVPAEWVNCLLILKYSWVKI